MKKFIIGIMTVLVLSGCSLIGEVNDSMEYTKEAAEHLNSLAEFAENAPQQIQEAANDPEAKEKLKDTLNTLKEEAEAFNSLDAPAVAEDIHENLVNKNEVLIEEVNKLVDSGNIAIDKIEDSEIMKTINDATDLLNRIENLGL